MKFTVDLGRWTTTKAALAVAGALAIGGAMGSALAIAPTMQGPVKWAGGAEFVGSLSTGIGGGSVAVLTVPAGRNLMLTDIVVGNVATTAAAFNLIAGTSNCSNVLAFRLGNIVIPPNDVRSISLSTGIGFASGQNVCIFSPNQLSFNLRGYYFTPG